MYYIITLCIGLYIGFFVAKKTYEDEIKEQQMKRNRLLKDIMPIACNDFRQLERDTQLGVNKASSSLGSSWFKDKTDPTKKDDAR